MLVLEQRSVLGQLRHGDSTSLFAFGLRPPHIHTHCCGPLGVSKVRKCSQSPKNTCGGATCTSYRPVVVWDTLRAYVLFCVSTLPLFSALCVSKNRTHKFTRLGFTHCKA
jgi:hypothetical protein